MVHVVIFLLAATMLIGMTNTPAGQAVSGFVLAGIIPGTSVQLPWYFMLILAPLVAYSLGRLLYILSRENTELGSKHRANTQPGRKNSKKTTSKRRTNTDGVIKQTPVRRTGKKRRQGAAGLNPESA